MVRRSVEPLRIESSNSSKGFPRRVGPRVNSISSDDGCGPASPDSFLRIIGPDRYKLSHGQEMYSAETRVLGLVEIKSEDHSGVIPVAVTAIRIAIISVVRETPVMLPIVLAPMIALVMSPVTVHPVAGLGRGWKNSQTDGERDKANPKFVHKRGSCFQFCEKGRSSEQ